MSKRNRPRVNLTDYLDKKGSEGGFDIDLPDGSSIAIPPPEVWPEEVANAGQEDVKAIAKALLGDRYDEFIAAGGSSFALASMVQEFGGGDVTAGE